MLEQEEIEEDYFTPVSSTTLANIFGKSNTEPKTDNETLKYTPPKPQSVAPKPEESKVTQCIFACALFGFEWINDAYTPKRKLGFAILKTIKTGYHNIVLYDSNKTTLSCATITSALEVTVRGAVNISYYDNLQKYWSINCSEAEVKKIIEILKSLNVIIKYSAENKTGPHEPSKIEDSEPAIIIEPPKQADKESDTDSSINRRTKMSILNRMANMGHSVLPPHTLSKEKTSDSSDTNDANNCPKTIRHKPVKGTVKRNISEKNITEVQSLIETHKLPRPEYTVEHTPPLYTHVNGQLVPVASTNIVSGPSNTNEMNLFVSEQRISNSELRINMNRMTDKVDQLSSKITDLTCKHANTATTNFQMEILQKLLVEYENKIKAYEEIIRSKGIGKHSNIAVEHECGVSSKQQSSEDTDRLNSMIFKLQQNDTEKDEKISDLQFELHKLKQITNEITDIRAKNNYLIKENEELKEQLAFKNEEFMRITEHKKDLIADKPDNDNIMKEKIKKIMNNTFHAMSVNFNDNDNYTGDTIKSVVTAVIKKVTLETLKEL